MPHNIQTNDGLILVGQECNIEEMSFIERTIWNSKDILISKIPGASRYYSSIKLVETIDYTDKRRFTLGAFEPRTKTIYITRVSLESVESFCKVLLHELAHGKSNNADGSIEFETDLSDLLGYIGSALVKNSDSKISEMLGNETSIHNMDNDVYGYANCRCVHCQSTSFEYNDDLSYVICKECGYEYTGGYAELIELNRQSMKDNPQPYMDDALRINKEIQSKSNHLLFEGIPLTGTMDYFINQLESNKIIEPESELQKIARSMTTKPSASLFTGEVLGLKERTILVVPNDISGMVGQVIVVLSDYDYSAYMSFKDLLTNKYGEATLEIPKPGFIWKLNTGDVSLILDQNQGLMLVFTDKINEPN